MTPWYHYILVLWCHKTKIWFVFWLVFRSKHKLYDPVVPWCGDVVGLCGCWSRACPLGCGLWCFVGGLAIAPQTPYRRNNKRGLSLHRKPWVTKAGGWGCGHLAPSLALLEGWVNLSWFKPLKTLVDNGFLIPTYHNFMVSWFHETFACYCRWTLVLGLVLVSSCYGVMAP